MTESVETAIVEELQDAEPSVPETFCVRDAESANWLVRRILEARAYAERVAAWAERERRRAQREEEFFLARFGPQLRTFAAREIAKSGGRRKSLNLPSGRIGFRAVPAKIVIEDEIRVIEWARVHCPDAVQKVESIAKAVLDQHVASTGEIPPSGVRVEEAGERFYLK